MRAVLLALALLVAQQAALAHAIWHLDASPSQGEGQKRLCDLHDALGTVLGALDAAAPAVRLDEPPVPQFRVPQAGQPGLPPPTPASRDPPTLR